MPNLRELEDPVSLTRRLFTHNAETRQNGQNEETWCPHHPKGSCHNHFYSCVLRIRYALFLSLSLNIPLRRRSRQHKETNPISFYGPPLRTAQSNLLPSLSGCVTGNEPRPDNIHLPPPNQSSSPFPSLPPASRRNSLPLLQHPYLPPFPYLSRPLFQNQEAPSCPPTCEISSLHNIFTIALGSGLE